MVGLGTSSLSLSWARGRLVPASGAGWAGAVAAVLVLSTCSDNMLAIKSRSKTEVRRGDWGGKGEGDGENPVGALGSMIVGEVAGDALLGLGDGGGGGEAVNV